jgi:hypothetical protein
MAKRYIIDEIRADHWMVRMHDRETDEVVEVPLELGALWPGKLRGDAVPREPGEPATSRSEPPTPREPEASPLDDLSPVSDDPAPVTVEPRAEKKPRKRGAARATDPVDEALIEPEDVAAPNLQQRMGRANRARKVGELGWSETTDDGRSGLVSRFGGGVYKILHAGADTYALFFEWDDGRYDKLGCGTAEAMMDLANFKAKEEPPAAAAEPHQPGDGALCLRHPGAESHPRESGFRVRSMMRRARPRRSSSAPAESAADQELRRSLHRENARYKARKERERRDEPAPDPIAPNAAMDQQLTDSLKEALAKLDAQETKGQGGE